MNDSFAKALRSQRMKKGLSQQQLADMLFVDRSSVTNWETGRRMPDFILISRIAECLDCDVASLLSSDEDAGSKPVVIIVDDEKLTLSGALSVLEKALPSALIVSFTKPSEAIAFAKNCQVCLAFLDIELGNVNGLDLCRDLLMVNPQMNIVFLTAYMEYSFDAWSTGACGFLLKPVSVEAIHQQLKNLRYPVKELI